MAEKKGLCIYCIIILGAGFLGFLETSFRLIFTQPLYFDTDFLYLAVATYKIADGHINYTISLFLFQISQFCTIEFMFALYMNNCQSV